MATTVPAVPPPATIKSKDVFANVAASRTAADAKVVLSARVTNDAVRCIAQERL